MLNKKQYCPNITYNIYITHITECNLHSAIETKKMIEVGFKWIEKFTKFMM